MPTRYYITTAVWFEDEPNHEKISNLLIHFVNEDEALPVHTGKIYNKAEAIELATKYYLYTAQWLYSKQSWSVGAQVNVIKGKSGNYLRSDADKTERDNLGHLLPGANLNIE